MNNQKTLQFVLRISCLIIALFPVALFAQGGGGPIPPHVLPLEGGIGILLALGVAFGVRKFIGKRKK